MRHLIQTVGVALVINDKILQSAIDILVKALSNYLSWAIRTSEDDFAIPHQDYYCNWESHEYYSTMKYVSDSIHYYHYLSLILGIRLLSSALRVLNPQSRIFGNFSASFQIDQ